MKKRTNQFALSVFKFLMKLERNTAVDVISYQLLKATSSVAANYRVALIEQDDQKPIGKL